MGESAAALDLDSMLSMLTERKVDKRAAVAMSKGDGKGASDDHPVAKGKAKAKAKAKGSAKSKNKGQAKSKGKAKTKSTGGDVVLGCSKCRWSASGCGQCRKPGFAGHRWSVDADM